MIAVQISPDIPMVVIGAPGYLARHSAPPSPADLLAHRCINLHLPMAGTGFAWPPVGEKGVPRVSVKRPISLNTIEPIRDAALDGHGLACVPLDTVQAAIMAGRLISVLPGGVPNLPRYHLHYANGRNANAAFKLLADSLRWQG